MSMQSLDVISINLWQMLISLCNLVILYAILKKFLYKPVRNMIAKRQEELDRQYADAAEAQKRADANRQLYDQKIRSAQHQAEEILWSATADAGRNSTRILDEARDKASGIVRQAQRDAELEKRKAEEEIRGQIADVSTALTEKLHGRELRGEDHRELIDSFLKEMGEPDDGNE